MHSFHLLPTALLSLCVTGSPIVRRQLRAVDQAYSGPPYNITRPFGINGTFGVNGTFGFNGTSGFNGTFGTNNTFGPYGTCNGTDVYNEYTGDGSCTDGWPAMDQWASFDYLWNANLPLINNSCEYIGAGGPNNSPWETATVGTMIQAVANDTNIDPRFILAVMMQESKGCVRVQTTFGSNCNPGLMQDHCGSNTCFGIDPCPASTIYGMIQDGVGGTVAGDGLAGIMNKLTAGNATNELYFGNSTSQEQLYYRAARMYNSGSIDSSGNLGLGAATHCYASDIANRLTGWVMAPSTCTLNAVY